MSLYQNLGFSHHPFTKTNADEEPFLDRYFVFPPYFEAVVGDALHPSASIVFAPRGAGKTALKRMVENAGIEKKFLAVTYNRFEFSNGEKISDISLSYHLKNIISRVLISLLSYISENEDLIKKLSKDEKRNLGTFVNTYLGDLTGDELQDIVTELKSLPEKFKTFWSENVGFMEKVINFILERYGLDEIDLPEIRTESKKLSQTYKHQLEILLQFTKKIGFNSIYILIDKVDESEKTGNDSQATYQLIMPMLKDLDLLGSPGYGFKFFLWDVIQERYRKDGRPDRVTQHKLNWNREGLKEILSERLKAFSDGKIHKFAELVKDSGGLDIDIDDAICVMANKSPRNMIRICEKIFSAESMKSGSSKNISINSVDLGIIEYCEEIVSESFTERTVKEIQKVGRELFTTNYIANEVLKITGEGARNKITAWAREGIVKQIGTISQDSSKRPLHFYCITDPAAVRLIHRKTTIQSFIKDRWIPCDYCNTDNIMDIDYFTDNNDAVCKECGRDLI